MERNLTITITKVDNAEFQIDVLEGESGTNVSGRFPFSPDEHIEFNDAIGNEIYSWVSMMMDEED